MTIAPLASPSMTDWRLESPRPRANARHAEPTAIRSRTPGAGTTAEPRALPVPGLGRPITVKLATERDEFEQAFRLLSANYRSRGYEVPSDKPFRFSPHHVLPETLTAVAQSAGEVVATLSLVPDNPILGLPLEDLYGPEIAALRRRGARLAEASGLADQGLSMGEFLRVFRTLIRLVMQIHRWRGGDSWVIAVNPRHAAFYRKVLGFRTLGPRRAYATVQGHPAEAFLLEVPMMRIDAPEMYEEIFHTSLSDDYLVAPPRPESHARYFGARSSQTDSEMVERILGQVCEREGFGLARRASSHRPRATAPRLRLAAC